MSPTQRSLAKLRCDGWTVCIVEKWVPASAAGFKGRLITRDAFGFADLLACKIGQPALLVQTTTGSNAAARVSKITATAEAGIWLAAGHRIIVHAWRKVGACGKRKTWQCLEKII